MNFDYGFIRGFHFNLFEGKGTIGCVFNLV